MQPLKSPSVYQDLHTDLEHQDETHRDADASASPLMGSIHGEKAWSDITAGDHHQEHHGAEDAVGKSSRRKRICAIVVSIRSVLDTILLLVILGLLVERRWYGKSGSAEKSSDIAGDITGFAPPSMLFLLFKNTDRHSCDDGLDMED